MKYEITQPIKGMGHELKKNLTLQFRYGLTLLPAEALTSLGVETLIFFAQVGG